MVKARNRLIESIRKQAIRASKEGAVAFEDLGIDMILVDESHEFKKPPIATRMSVKGLNKGTSDRSLSLRFLTNYVKGQRGGTGVHVFTGTPLTNTLTEIYHQMYYAMDDVMRVNKVDTWDGFFKTFANTISDVEVTSTNEYESVERLAAFINVSELRRMAGQYMDIVFADDMPEFKPRVTASGKDMSAKDLTDAEKAELLDGRNDDPQGRPYKKVVHDIGPMGTDQQRILQETVGYARAFKNAGGKARREIMQNGGPNAPIVYEFEDVSVTVKGKRDGAGH
jgi:N12 class adenine-specific DNA methylase